ncbi:MAG: SGNH/GDSL hydrolase family protein [Deltaproteobacteria bacterium]|nr:SGNH/GDSL hydrolase family protein [Deltaproteobacteria bacterium]
MIIIKECPAYFPMDVGISIRRIKGWISTVRGAGIVPIIATVSPVTEKRDIETSGQQVCIDRFNEKLVKLASEEGVPLFDMASFIRKGAHDTHLDEKFADPDGLHLNAVAYRRLDKELVAFLNCLGTKNK